jgi:ADP-ribose pyrophosphatase YjhB (NUDIX family)
MTALADTVHKVAALITRGEGAGRELLVFRHPSASIQLPAGTVEMGEEIEAAALREVHEETGLTDVAIVARLAMMAEVMGTDERMITTSGVRLRVEPSDAAGWVEVHVGAGVVISALGRGLKVRHMRDGAGYLVEGDYAQIGYDLYDIRGPHDWVLRETIVGWVPLTAITADAQRHLFHMETTAPTPDRWVHHGDVPGCELYWTPLADDPGLVKGQDLWRLAALEQLGSYA